MKEKVLGSALALLLLCQGAPLLADSPAANFTYADVIPGFTNSFSNNAGGFDLGWKFSVNAPLNVTQLGVFDDFGDGLISSHAVALYKADGTQVVAGTVLPTDPLTGTFRYTSVGSVSLGVGDYVLVSVAGYDPGNPVDLYTHDPANITFDPNITFIGNRVRGNLGNTLVFLTDSDTEVSINPPLYYGWFGPNMMTNDVKVPEPATYLTLGAMGLLALWCKRKQRQAALCKQ